MFQANTSVFVGKDRFSGFRDHIAAEGFFFLFEAESDMTKAEGHALMKDVQRLKDEKGDIRSLGDLEVWMNGLTRIKNIPEQYSIACGVQVDDIVYLQTVGKGEVHLRRGKDFVRLIHGDKSASGYIKEGDMFVFTTSSFRTLIEEEEKLQDPMDKDEPPALVTALEDYFDKKNDAGSVGIFTQFSKNAAPAAAGAAVSAEDEAEKMGFSHTPQYHARAVESTEVEEDEPAEDATPELPPMEPAVARRAGLPVMEMPESSAPAPGTPKKNPFPNFHLPESPLPKNVSKMITIVVVVILAVIFIWSVVFGLQRRKAAEVQKKIQATEMDVDKKTAQADEDAFLNLDKSVALLADAKKEVKDLEAEIGSGHSLDIARLNKKITDKENAIMHKDEKAPEEFYDLALENKNATGDVMFLEKDNIAILDTQNKTIYNLSAEKKSITKSKNDILADANMVGMVKGVLFAFVPGKGLYEFSDDTKVKNVIANDKDWGTIADIAYFAGNVYMLDSGKKDVYKYTLITDGYAPKKSYFNSKPDLSDVRSMKIDSSIYISASDSILKFTRGDADEFKVSFPTTKVDIEKIYTDEDATKVYAWDKTNAVIYIMGKNGTYEKQIKAGVLAKATDIIAYKGDILVLSGSKIYKLTETDAKKE